MSFNYGREEKKWRLCQTDSWGGTPVAVTQAGYICLNPDGGYKELWKEQLGVATSTTQSLTPLSVQSRAAHDPYLSYPTTQATDSARQSSLPPLRADRKK